MFVFRGVKNRSFSHSVPENKWDLPLRRPFFFSANLFLFSQLLQPGEIHYGSSSGCATILPFTIRTSRSARRVISAE